MHIIDTHILLWLLSEPEKLTETAKTILQEDELYISMASFRKMERNFIELILCNRRGIYGCICFYGRTKK